MLAEDRKITLVRKALAILQLLRTLQIGWCYYHYQNGQMLFEEFFYLFLSSALLVLLFLGKYLSITSLACAVVIPKFDTVLLVPTIADNLLCFMCLFFAAHHFFITKSTSDDQVKSIRLNTLYWLLFVSYCIINILSAVLHLQDAYWQNGTAMGELLMASSISRFFEFFRYINLKYPGFMSISKMITWSVLLTQFLILPMYLFRIGRRLLLIWATVLIIFIWGLFEVVILPHFTILLFVLLLYRKNVAINWQQIITGSKGGAAFRKMVFIFYAALTLHLALKTPGISNLLDKTFWLAREWDSKLWFSRKMNLLGFGQPDVLNTGEIESSHKWFTIVKEINGRSETLNILDSNGRRLNYYPDPLLFGNQGSDYIKKNMLFYGMSSDTFTYQNSATPYKEKGRSVDRLIRFDYSASFHKVPITYTVTYYKLKNPGSATSPSKDFSIDKYETRRYKCFKGVVTRI